MASAYDVYDFYLEAETLKGRSVVVHVESVQKKDVFNPRIKRNEPKLVMRFAGKKLAMCLNKTQTGDMIAITGTDDYDLWKGHTITIAPTVSNGKPTIAISKPPQAQADTSEQ